MAFDVAAFVEDLRERKIMPHIARHDPVTKTGKRRRTKLDGRTTRHAGYDISQGCRKRIEEIFGWAKVQAGLRPKPPCHNGKRPETSPIGAIKPERVESALGKPGKPSALVSFSAAC
ncbi:MAG: hypothetical protein O7A04_00505 [Acidobacteria bacterium]|nr:hypothetical protein [Acidobacteriota bacterium]